MGQPHGFLKYPYYLYSRYAIPAVGGRPGNRRAYVYLQQSSARFPAGQKFLDLMGLRAGRFSHKKAYALAGCIAYTTPDGNLRRDCRQLRCSITVSCPPALMPLTSPAEPALRMVPRRLAIFRGVYGAGGRPLAWPDLQRAQAVNGRHQFQGAGAA